MPLAPVHSPLSRILPIAGRQFGVFSWHQARDAGLSKSDVRALKRDGTLRHPYTGVYALRALEERADERQLLRSSVMAAQLALGPHSFAGGETAAHLWGMQGLPPWDGHTVHMVIPALGAQRHHHHVTLHSWQVGPEEVASVDGTIRATTPDRTLRDTVLRVGRAAAVSLLDSALHQKLILEEGLEELEAANNGRKGCVRSRPWWGLADGRAESPLETRVRLICTDGGLPPTDLQHRFFDADGRTLAITDFWWEGLRLIGEADGLAPHSLPEALAKDRKRQNALQALYPGVRIARFTWDDLKRPGYILSVIARSGRR
ncbi:type IV toxin-antitoxin system AbiEi family antitoxin domain-containing protein [Nocardiopsis sp. HNM0947]|uniref:Type IV toxin-antitoxin system AbiEi family antitoxin domain-containing protein n=1 Tax=Nocardiopsis coralli TaxID=2772213 RepID=A0ABR9PAC4_9ACTN|nr:type IV toxin-antitoxin system AbiEi family antitoxin domain-containing protein [Nocardiopsis coralli]